MNAPLRRIAPHLSTPSLLALLELAGTLELTASRPLLESGPISLALVVSDVNGAHVSAATTTIPPEHLDDLPALARPVGELLERLTPWTSPDRPIVDELVLFPRLARLVPPAWGWGGTPGPLTPKTAGWSRARRRGFRRDCEIGSRPHRRRR